MKKQFALSIILFIMIFSVFNTLYRFVPSAKATYVEGFITKDTIWTLVDSPFVLSNNVTINPEATLTIEPGVDVRFGGDFSLIVNGRIIADGTENRTIRFTADDPSHSSVWRTITINGSQPASFKNCVIEYGTNATTLENGNAEFENVLIRSNTENGIAVNNGTLSVKNSEIANNTLAAINIADGGSITIENDVISSNGDGIRVADGDQIAVQYNALESNGNGIFLTGNLTGTISIKYNNVSHNSQTGIVLGFDNYNIITIMENHVLDNNYGFLVSTNATTYLTNNYISNNTIGINYETTNNHQAHFNDIYDNGKGMDISTTVSTGSFINATYNYWGHKSGPKHDSLNPYGRGNSVGGDGVNLRFVFFLTHPFGYANIPPKAVLWTDKALVGLYQPVTFIGTDSQDDGTVDQYFFSFGDETNSDWTTLSLFNHSYSSAGVQTAALYVKDDSGIEGTSASATINVADLATPEVFLILSNHTIGYNANVMVTAYVVNGGVGLQDANVTFFGVGDGSFAPKWNLTDANGYATATFTAPNVTDLTNIRIIARASITGYADGSGHEYVKVLPPLNVHVNADPAIIRSEETANIKVSVANSLEEPVEGVNLTLSSQNGPLSAIQGTTDADGTAMFTFTASMTQTEITGTVTVTANKQEYAAGQGQVEIVIKPRMLVLEVTANSGIVISGETSTITVRATYDSTPLRGVTVIISSDAGGNFSFTMQTTNPEGLSTFIYTAPIIVMKDGINATITAVASMNGYVDVVNHETVLVMPRVLSVQISARTNSTFSQGALNTTVHVGYGTTSIAGARVSISADSGSFSTTPGTTDANGNITFTYAASQVNAESDVLFSATATADGFVEGRSELRIIVNLRTFGVQIISEPLKVGELGMITVPVTCVEDSTPVSGAAVSLSYGHGSPLTNTTDSTGKCSFAITPNEASETGLNLTLSLTKDGYKTSQLNVIVGVAALEVGFPWLMILMIVIPIGVVAVIVVLVKLKVIVVSVSEET